MPLHSILFLPLTLIQYTHVYIQYILYTAYQNKSILTFRASFCILSQVFLFKYDTVSLIFFLIFFLQLKHKQKYSFLKNFPYQPSYPFLSLFFS